MAANDDTRKEWLIGKIMDIFFDSGTDLPEELHAKVVLWLLDEKDAELKEKHMMRKFDEMIGTDDTDIPTPKIQHPV